MPTLEISLLGPFQVRLGGERVSHYKTAKVRALLAYLIMECHHPQPREALAELLWPEQSEAAARLNLRQTFHRLRQVIPSVYWRVTRHTIQFDPDSDYDLDVSAFTELTTICRRHPHLDLGACRPCLTRLQQATNLYQGDFLADFFVADSVAFEEWARLKREWLRHEALQALYHLTAHHEQQGTYEAAYGYAWRQVALDPLREEAHRQLMHILAASGRRSEALAQYETCRRALAEALGIEPEAETTALYERIRNEQISRRVEESKDTSELAPVLLHNLPSQPTSLIGREKELTEINALLANPNCRLVTLIGPGGIGKTRLSVEAAQQALTQFDDGAYFVSLASTDSVEDIMPRIATAVDPETYPTSQTAANFLPQLHKRDPMILLVLDNLEQLLPDGSASMDELLTQTRRLKLIVTSRQALNIRWEWRYNLNGLAYPSDETADALESYSAVEMFLQRVRQTRPTSLSEVEVQAAAQICRLVDGMPLGIELAAAQAGRLSCPTIAAALERNLDAPVVSLRDVPARQRSLRASFEVTWANLSPDEQAVFRRLSLFRSSFTAAAAQAVAETGPSQVINLIDKSLLQQASPQRYDMHLVLRHFAQEKLAEIPVEQAQTLTRYRDYYTTFLHEYTAALEQSKDLTENLAAFNAEIDNLWAGWARIIGQPDAEAFASVLFRAMHAAGHARFMWLSDVLLMLEHHQRLSRSRSSEVDVSLIDLIWIDTLADHLRDLGQDFEDETLNHFSVYIENNVVDGRLLALPFWADMGVLYYRADLLLKYGFAAPPTTWDELEQMAAEIQAGERAEGRRDFWGYIWQGRKHESLTCNALEWQASHGGGRLIEPEGVITVNNPQTIAAFERAAGWVGTISPETVTEPGLGQEKASKEAWVAGNVAFMRNWYHFVPGRIDTSLAKDRIGLAPLPGGEAGSVATLGGQQITISKYARHPREAIELVRYATGRQAQLQRVLSWPYWPPTTPDLYDHPAVVALHPFLPRVKDAFSKNSVVARPSKVCGKLYPQVSRAYSTAVHSILTGQVEAAKAVADLEAKLVEITGFRMGHV